MHSTIFQITTDKVEEKDALLNEGTLLQGDNLDLDYCSDIDKNDRRERIEYLVNEILPEGMFTLIDENTIHYNGGVEAWQEEWVKQINEKCSLVTASNIHEWSTLYYLKEAINNLLDAGSRFYDDNSRCSSYSDKSGEFMKSLNNLEAGTLLYVGDVIDYDRNMNKYNWKGYDFIGTVPEFAEKFGYCKPPTFVNAIKRVPRHRYNCMDAVEQRAYEEKRRRVKRACCIYMNEDMIESYIITKEEYLAANLPVREKHHEPFLLSYSNGIRITFNSEQSRDGLDNCHLSIILTLTEKGFTTVGGDYAASMKFCTLPP